MQIRSDERISSEELHLLPSQVPYRPQRQEVLETTIRNSSFESCKQFFVLRRGSVAVLRVWRLPSTGMKSEAEEQVAAPAESSNTQLAPG